MPSAVTTTLRRMWTVVLCGVCAAPLASLATHHEAAGFLALVIVLAVGTALRPAAGLVALVLLLPGAHLLEILLHAPTSDEMTFALLLAFSAGAALRVAWPAPEAPDRLGRPALLIALVVLASAVIQWTRLHAGDPRRPLAGALWIDLSDSFLFEPASGLDLHPTVLWIACAAAAVCAERIVRRSPAVAPVAIRMWFVGSAAASTAALQRFAEVLLSHPGHRIETMQVVLHARITALFPDVNAAGSYFVLFLVAAIAVGVARRSVWLLAGVVPLLAGAFALAQSRAAIAGAGLVLAVMAAQSAWKRRQLLLVAAVVVIVAAVGLAGWAATRTSHASVSSAMAIRVDMTRVAMEITRQHPVFGGGLGSYVEESRQFISDRLPALYAFAPRGENAHNNFLQILAELGVVGFAAFVWMVGAGLGTRSRIDPGSPTAIEARGLTGGLAAFLLSAAFGHPLLIPQVAAAFFVTLGLVAGILTPPRPPAWPGRVLAWGVVCGLLATLPWRIQQELRFPPLMAGVSDVKGTLDGVSYRVADSGAIWRIPASASSIDLPVRWARPSPGCAVQVFFDGREADRVLPPADGWQAVSYRLTDPDLGQVMRTLQLRLSGGSCELLVGPLVVRP